MNTKTFSLIGFFSILLLQSYSQSSVLATGNWYKMAVYEEGIYRITFTDLQNMGINPTSIDPRNIAMYGNPAGMLKADNSAPQVNDLQQMRIFIKGESDGIFAMNDTIFFYGQSSVRRIIDANNKFSHEVNIYSDSVYYFLTVGNSPGLRIEQRASQVSFTNTTTIYTDFIWHETDSVNFLRSGKMWFGEQIKYQSPVTFNPDLQNVSPSDTVFLKTKFIGRSLTGSSQISATYNNTTTSLNFANVGTSSQDNYGAFVTLEHNLLNATPGTIEYNLSGTNPSAVAWIDFFEMNFTRQLILFKPQQVFCDLNSVSPSGITKFNVNNSSPNLKIWDVTDPLNVVEQLYSTISTFAEFNSANDVPHTYLAFDGNQFLTPVYLGQIPNQDLHSITQANMLIITTDLFQFDAQRLANFHQSNDGLNTIVVNVEQIYNEYSTGAQDITGIRNFIRQVYNHSASVNDSLKYLLLFGNASFDFRNKLGFTAKCIPTMQSAGSINLTQTFCTDGFFTTMAGNATELPSDTQHIAVGRLPVINPEDGKVVDKIINYSSNSDLSSWKKKILFVADDEDASTHIIQMDTLSNRIENMTCDYDIDKVYIDSYTQVITPTHQSYPDAEIDINNRIENGCMVVEFIGRGGELGWAHERILDTTDILGYRNQNLPLFIHATSELNEYDYPARMSIGEMIALTDSGAGIGSISVSRLGFSSSNYNILQKINKYLFERVNGQYHTLGDILKKARNETLTDPYIASMNLLGDPAVRLIGINNKVSTTSFNGIPVSSNPDTVAPGQPLQIAGQIEDASGSLVNTFNGHVTITVFNQKTLHFTLDNDNWGATTYFYEWDDTLRSMDVSVVNGIFDTTFYVPWAIDSGIGFGKISYYAQDGISDASGCYTNFIYKNLTPGIEEPDADNINVFPNPVKDNLFISIDNILSDDYHFTLFDVIGRKILSEKITDQKNIININRFSSGIYTYTLLNGKSELIKKGKLIFH